jgi:hypothetical protein
MFVPVSCTNCGKPFQVPEAALGQLAPCPWCGATVTALPVSAPVAQAQAPAPPAPDAQQEPLSLDDEPEVPPGRAKPGRSQDDPPRERKPQPAAPAAPPSGKRFVGFALMVALGVTIAVAVSLLTVAALKRKSGFFVSADWKTFTAPDGSCTVDLPGTPVEDPDAPAAGGRRYVSEGWYSGAKAWVGWKELTPAEVQMANGPEAWQLLRPTVLNPERERLKAAFGGYEAEGGGTKSFQPLVTEYRLQTPEGLLVERAIVKADGPRPRAYFVGIVGKRLAADGPEAERLFNSFRTND